MNDLGHKFESREYSRLGDIVNDESSSDDSQIGINSQDELDVDENEPNLDYICMSPPNSARLMKTKKRKKNRYLSKP